MAHWKQRKNLRRKGSSYGHPLARMALLIPSVNRQNHIARILLVEDSEDDAFFFQHALKKTQLPCECDHVMDGGKAVEYLQTSQQQGRLPDLIFLDLKLPVMSGFEVLKWVGEQKFQPPLNIAILSGSDHESDVKLARELGASDYVVKPISPEDCKQRLVDLTQRIAAHLGTQPDSKAAA